VRLSFASLTLVTPPSLIRIVSEPSLSSVELSTFTFRDIVLPSDTEPPPPRPEPAVTVTALLASSTFATPPSLIVTSPE